MNKLVTAGRSRFRSSTCATITPPRGIRHRGSPGTEPGSCT